MKILFDLFLSFVQIGLFSVGGGLASIPLIQEQVVNIHAWMSIAELTDLVTIAQMTPGPIAINSATFVGTRIYGVIGAIIATLGCIIPSCILVLLLGKLYFKYKNLSIIHGVLSGLRPAIIALIASAGMDIFLTMAFPNSITDVNFVGIGIFIGAIIVLTKTKIDPIVVMLSSGVIGALLYIII